MQRICYLLLLILGTVACGQARQSPQQVLGVMLPLTGDLASYGNSGREGLQIAVELYKATHPTTTVKVVTEDDKGTTRVALSAFAKLVSQDRARIVVGAMSSGVTLAIAPIANRDKIVLLAPTSTASEVTTAGDYIFRVCASDAFEGPEMARYIKRHWSDRRVGVVYIDNAYGVGLKTDFLKQALRDSLSIVLQEGYSPTTSDFRPLVLKAKRAEITVLYVVAQKEQLQLFRTMRQLAFSPQITASTMLQDGDLLKAESNTIAGAVYTYRSYDPADTVNSSTRDFVRNYKTRFSREPDFYAASVFDAVTVALHALDATAKNHQELKQFLYSLKNFPGVTGDISFDENGDVGSGFMIKTVKDGHFMPASK